MGAAGSESCLPEVRVIGTNAMHNELMVSFIRTETGLYCTYCHTADLTEKLEEEDDRTILYLLDAQDTDLYVTLTCFDVGGNPLKKNYSIAAYNLDPDMEFDREALDRGLKGIFFKNEPLGNIAKGIRAILDGDFWYSRKTLSQYLWEQRTVPKLKGEAAVELTAREKEVLLKIYSGKCNKDIADELCISFHTVKTHVYNIFRKIQVNSRFQATLWAAKYL